MVRNLALKGAAGTIAALVAAAGLVAPASAQVGPQTLDHAGAVIGWGSTNPNFGTPPPTELYTVPADLQGTAFSKVVANSDFTVALTSAGKVVVWGESGAGGANISQIPPSVAAATVADIATGGTWAGAVMTDGRVVVWGVELDTPDPTDVPDGLTGVSKLAMTGGAAAAAIKTNGDVVAWGDSGFGVQNGKPENVGANPKSLVAGQNHYYALKADGTVAAWGDNSNGQTTLPPEVASGNVKDIESRFRGGLALLNDGSLASWGQYAVVDPEFDPYPVLRVPESLEGKNVVAIAAAGTDNLALEADGTVTMWSVITDVVDELSATVPAEITSGDVASLSFGGKYVVAVVTKMLEATKATVSGTPTIGQTLTGTPATFSGAPDATSSQWLADGVAIAGATGNTLALTAAHAGKRITFATTATKAGVDPFVSTSVQSGPVTAPQGPSQPQPRPQALVSSKPTFRVNKAPTSKKTGKATVAVGTVSGRAKATGKATVTIKKGKTTKKISVTLSGGKKSISLPKLKKGTWKVQVSYNGDKNYVAQKSKTINLKIKK